MDMTHLDDILARTTKSFWIIPLAATIILSDCDYFTLDTVHFTIIDLTAMKWDRTITPLQIKEGLLTDVKQLVQGHTSTEIV